MRIKKLAAIAMATVMAISMCACEAKEKTETSGEVSVETQAEEKSSFDEAAYLTKIDEEMTSHLAALVEDENFIELYSSSDDIKDVRKGLVGTKADMTKDFQEMIIGDNVYERYVSAMEEDGPVFSELNPEAQEQINRTLGTALGSVINGQSGVVLVAFNGIYNYSRTYVPEEHIDNRIRIIPTDGDASFFVSYSNTGDGALTVSVCYVFLDERTSEVFMPFFGDDLKTISR